MPRQLGCNQLAWLRSIATTCKGRWYAGCGVIWGGYRTSARLCESLERRGLLASGTETYSDYNGRPYERTVWTITEAGRKALEA